MAKLTKAETFAVGWHDRFHGHGDWGVLDGDGTLIAEVVSGKKEHADLFAASPALLAACKGAQVAARNICENATNYKKLTIPQLRFFVETATAMLSGLATVADAAIALAEPPRTAPEAGKRRPVDDRHPNGAK